MGAALHQGQNMVFRKIFLGGSTCAHITFWLVDKSLHNFRCRTWEELYSDYHACLAARHVKKFRDVTLPSHKAIGAHTLNFWIYYRKKTCSGRNDCRHIKFPFWISLFLPEIFAIEVWSCPKPTLILYVFGLYFFWKALQMFGPGL